MTIVHHIISIFSKSCQMVKKMTPVRTAKYDRQNRIAQRHVQTVEYIAVISI